MIDKNDIPVVILCGGKGLRLIEETLVTPKPLVQIGGKPILWHIMKIYSHFGFKNFILLLGYKGEMIKSFFLNYPWIVQDFSMNNGSKQLINKGSVDDDWNITFLDTGQESLTGKRLYLAKEILSKYKYFMLTYGDGVSDINLDELLNFHLSKDFLITITGVKERSKRGRISYENGAINEFMEKPVLNEIINGGFMVFNSEVFNHMSEANTMLEDDLIPQLVKDKKVGLRLHLGFWHAMDTLQDKENLENLWKTNPEWKIWR